MLHLLTAYEGAPERVMSILGPDHIPNSHIQKGLLVDFPGLSHSEGICHLHGTTVLSSVESGPGAGPELEKAAPSSTVTPFQKTHSPKQHYFFAESNFHAGFSP